MPQQADWLSQPLLPLASHTPTQRAPTLEEQVEAVYAKFPRLRPLQIAVRDSRGQYPQVRGGLEYYPVDESRNPVPGRRTIELFDPSLAGTALQNALAGDMLHGLPEIDPRFAVLRRLFKQSLTPAQVAFDRQKFQMEGEAHDTFDSWMERSWLDAYIRGYLFPDRNDEWRKSGVYTDQQIGLLQQMRAHLLSAPEK